MASDLLVILLGILPTARFWNSTGSLQLVDLYQLLCAIPETKKWLMRKVLQLQIVFLHCVETLTGILSKVAWKYAMRCCEGWHPVEKSSFALEDTFKLEKQNYLYCLLGRCGCVQLVSFPVKKTSSFLDRAWEYTSLQVWLLEHWNKAIK